MKKYSVRIFIMGRLVGKKLYKLSLEKGFILLFYCPGCKQNHPFNIDIPGKPNWVWNQDGDLPKIVLTSNGMMNELFRGVTTRYL